MRKLLAVSLSACLVGLMLPLYAATLYWDGGVSDLGGDGDGLSGGGGGLWNTVLLNWDQGSGLAHTGWSNGAPDAAVFGGAAGLVTVGEAITADSITINTSGYVIYNDSESLISAATLAGAGALTKSGAGTLKLTGSSPYTGVLTIEDGMFELPHGATLADGGGIVIEGGRGTVGGAGYPFKGVTRGGTLYLRDDSGVPSGNQIGSQSLLMHNGTVLWHSGSGSDATTLESVTLASGFNSLGIGPTGNPDILKISNLYREDGATVEFRAAYHKMGTGEVQIQIENLNNSAIANVNGILGGWAFVAANSGVGEYGGPARDFAKWDAEATIGSSVGSIVAATPEKSSSSAALANGKANENWLADGGNEGSNRTINSDLTVNSLIEQADVVVNNDATLTLASGGLICRNNNFWLQSRSGTGYLTSGTKGLYVQVDGGVAASSDQFIKLLIKDGEAGPLTLYKSGPGMLKLDRINTYTGGTVVNQGVLSLQAGGESGCIRGSVTVNSGAELRLNAGDATGHSFNEDSLKVINLNGGKMHVASSANQTLGNAVINMRGGSITGVSNGKIDFFHSRSALNVLASPVTSVISGVPIAPLRQGNTTFTVADGLAEIDLEISSVIRDTITTESGTLTKAGAGTMLLSAVNTFSRPLHVAGGTLLVGSDGELGSGSVVSIAAGAMLGGSGNIKDKVSAAAGSSVGGGTLGSVGTLTLSGDGEALVLDEATICCDILADGTADMIVLSGEEGTLTLNGSSAVAVNLPEGGIAEGNYTLMTYSAVDDSNGELALVPPLRNATLIVGETELTLVVGEGGVSASSVLWQGDDNANVWDATAENWSYDGVLTAYAAGEGVVIDDSGSASPAINISPDPVSPSSIVVNNSLKDFTIGGGAITGAATLTKRGSGSLKLTSVNSFSGAVLVDGGVLEAAAATSGNASAIGNGTNPITVGSGAQLLFSGDRRAGYHSGAVTIYGGTVTGDGDDLSLAVANTVTFDRVAGVIDGSGLLRRRGVNNKVEVTPSASGSVISVGTLNLYGDAPVFDVADGVQSSDLTITSQITGGGVLHKKGTGTLTLSGENTYSGGNELLAGKVRVASMNAFGSGYMAVKFGTVIQYTGTGESRSGTYWFDNGDAGIEVVDPDAVLTLWRTAGKHNKMLIKSGPGTLRYGATSDNSDASALVNSGVLEAISSANNCYGHVTVNNGGVFRLGTTDGAGAALTANHQVWDGGSVTLNSGGGFELNDMDETVGTLNLNGGMVDGGGVLSVASTIQARSGVVASQLGGSGELIKSTSGVVTLSGANSYSGATSVNNGILYVNGTHSGVGAYTVAAGATLAGSGTITLTSGAVSVGDGGKLSPGGSAGSGGTLALSALTLESGASLLIDNVGDAVAVSGDLDLNACTISVPDTSSFDKHERYVVVTYGGSGSGTPVLDVDDPAWKLSHDAAGKRVYLRTSKLDGTCIIVR